MISSVFVFPVVAPGDALAIVLDPAGLSFGLYAPRKQAHGRQA
jgi:hypothetical protein